VQVTGTYVASGSGCTITAGAVGNACSATIHNLVAFPDANYQVTGCSVVGASDHVIVSSVAAPSNGAAFAVAEVALDATATGGGTINCTVVHN
jgi:N-dimethylarginine dimethylaminohydrolase